jgi:hypothetical protein
MDLFASFEMLKLARTFSRSKGVLAGKDLERAFAWLRPNDLIWNYWVNNYPIGEAPPAFDILRAAGFGPAVERDADLLAGDARGADVGMVHVGAPSHAAART